jgi:hypothetical protein
MSLWTQIKHYSIHAFGLTLSLSAIYHTMTQFSTVPLFSQFFGIGGVFAGLSIQYLRALAAAYRKRNKKGDKKKAVWLWVVVIVCICLFDFLSSFGILITQVDQGEEKYSALYNNWQSIEVDIKGLDQDIQAKKDQQEAEFTDNKGRGPNYDKFQKEIDRLTAQEGIKKAEANKIKAEMATMNKSIFARLGEKTGIPSFWIEFAMFAGLMFLIYFIPLLTPWKIHLEGMEEIETNETPKTVTSNITPETSQTTQTVSKPRKLKPVTALHETAVTGETVTPEQVTYDSELCICGCGEPRRDGSKYHSNACKTRMSRRTKAEQLQHMKSEGVRVF